MRNVILDKTLICQTKDCLFNRECANHETAGDFRSEGGFTPQVTRCCDGFKCHTINAEADEDYPFRIGSYPKGVTSQGMLYLEKGELKVYNGLWEG